MLLAIKRRFPTDQQIVEQKVGITKEQLDESLEKYGRKLKMVDGQIVVCDGD